jgi:predicted 3-demethylubiquinone-9 3-methyltransferase (glyoxalase superfamily)
MQKITSFLWFDTEAEEAAKFYVSVFKNKSKILSVARYGDAGPGPKGSVMVVEFMLDGQRFMALNGGPQFKFSPAFSLMVSCKTQKEIDYYWDKLVAGGAPSACGWLTDKFGFSWQIVPEIVGKVMSGKDAAKTNRFMAALMPMVKLDLATLEAAARGSTNGTAAAKRATKRPTKKPTKGRAKAAKRSAALGY